MEMPPAQPEYVQIGNEYVQIGKDPEKRQPPGLLKPAKQKERNPWTEERDSWTFDHWDEQTGTLINCRVSFSHRVSAATGYDMFVVAWNSGSQVGSIHYNGSSYRFTLRRLGCFAQFSQNN